MIFKGEFKIDIRDIDLENKLTNRAIMNYMEDMACRHSDEAGYGINDISKTKRIWLLLDWKLKVFDRPKYGDAIKVYTWSKGIERCYAYRDFEIYDSKENLIAIASTKWILMDSENFKLVKAEEGMASKYNEELGRKVFEKEELNKLIEPEQYISEMECKIRKTDTDMNNHVHNLNYLDLAYEILPYNISNCQQFENVRITYKKEIKAGSTVKLKYSKQEDKNIVVIKNIEETCIHSIIELW